jgi:hypothetical protein
MFNLDPEAFLLVPMALSVAFLVWAFWQLEKDARRKSRSEPRVVRLRSPDQNHFARWTVPSGRI